jgi:predicted transglutaminase-like cysteine proteinase
MPLDATQVAELQAVNSRINQIPYSALPGPQESVDWWTDIPVTGNSFVCRDYVLAKSDVLLAAGWEKSELTVILCWTEVTDPTTAAQGAYAGREYHAVLGVGGDTEVWILDSRADEIYHPSNMPFPYLWDRQQIAGTTEFRDASTGLV